MTGQQGSAVAIKVYEDNAAHLAGRYDAIQNEVLYTPVRHLIPSRPARVADIGTATGRDARWFASMGHAVTAVEPVAAFLDMARQTDARIDWVSDALPDLVQLLARGDRFDFINLMGVWHHLDPDERSRAAPVLRRLAAPGALLCLALRIGPLPGCMPVYETDPSATAQVFAEVGFQTAFQATAESIQEGNRAAGVYWAWLVLQAPGDSDAE